MDIPDRLAGKQPLQVACFSEDLKCWEAWDTTCGHKAKDITPSIAWRREAWKEEALDDLPWKDERGPSSIRRTLEPFQRQRWGNFWETGWSAYGLFRVHRYYLELNWTEQMIFFRQGQKKFCCTVLHSVAKGAKLTNGAELASGFERGISFICDALIGWNWLGNWQPVKLSWLLFFKQDFFRGSHSRFTPFFLFLFFNFPTTCSENAFSPCKNSSSVSLPSCFLFSFFLLREWKN